MNDPTQQFRDDVIQRLARLETKMDSLLVNGLEAKVRRHDRLIWTAIGGLTVLGPIVGYLAIQHLLVVVR